MFRFEGLFVIYYLELEISAISGGLWNREKKRKKTGKKKELNEKEKSIQVKIDREFWHLVYDKREISVDKHRILQN